MLALYLATLQTAEEKEKIILLYEENYEFLIKYANMLSADNSLSEDIVHNFFCKVIEQKDKYLKFNSKDFQRYGITSIRHLFLNELRNHKKEIVSDEIIEEIPDDNTPIEFLIEDKEDILLLQESLSQLTPLNREVIDCKYGLGMKISEIANELNLTENQVNSSLKRSRTKLKSIIQNKTAIILLSNKKPCKGFFI
jgi:RNA polymerase sigma-70 factor (ECF subfamily)